MNIVINPNFYIKKLQKRLLGELSALRSALRSIEKGEKLGEQSDHSPSNLLIIQDSQPEEIAQNEIWKTCCAVVRAFSDYIDELIAIQKFCSRPQKRDKDINTNLALNEYIREKIASKAQKIGRNGHLSKPEKIKLIGTLTEFLNDAISGYIELRSTIEHHKSVAQKDIKVSYYKQEYLVGGKVVNLNKPTVIKDTTIDLKVSEVSRMIKKGADLKLSEVEIEGIVLTLNLYIAPEIAKQAFK